MVRCEDCLYLEAPKPREFMGQKMFRVDKIRPKCARYGKALEWDQGQQKLIRCNECIKGARNG